MTSRMTLLNRLRALKEHNTLSDGKDKLITLRKYLIMVFYQMGKKNEKKPNAKEECISQQSKDCVNTRTRYERRLGNKQTGFHSVCDTVTSLNFRPLFRGIDNTHGSIGDYMVRSRTQIQFMNETEFSSAWE